MPDAAAADPTSRPPRGATTPPAPAGSQAVREVSGPRRDPGPADLPDPPAPWHLRVVGHDLVAPTDLINHPGNFRRHPPSQREALQAAIGEVGFVGEILVSRRSGRILDGHLRVAEAVRTGQALVPVGWVDCQSDEEEALILATHDPIGAMATADRARLADLAALAQVGDGPLKTVLAALAHPPTTPAPDEDDPAGSSGRIIGAPVGPQGGGHLGRVGDLIHPVVVECRSESEAEALLEELLEAGHGAYLIPASPSSLGDPPPGGADARR